MAINTRHRSPAPRLRVIIIPVLSALLCASAVIAGVYAWRWMEKPSSFPITQVVVQGDLTHVAPQTIQKAVKTQLTGGFFSLNVDVVRQTILSYPWVATVTFRRVWPNTLRVRVAEQKPVARFGSTGVVTADGHVFYPAVKSIPQDLPLLEGPIDQISALTAFYQNADMLAKLLGLSIVSLRINAIHSWYLQLSNQMLVKLGRQDALPRFKRFVAIYPKILQSSKAPIVSVDLRYPDGVAVQFGQIQKS